MQSATLRLNTDAEDKIIFGRKVTLEDILELPAHPLENKQQAGQKSKESLAKEMRWETAAILASL